MGEMDTTFSADLELSAANLSLIMALKRETVEASGWYMSILSQMWSLFNTANLRHSVLWSFVLIFGYSSVFVIGGVGNVLVMLVIWLKRPMHSVTNMLLFNLAVADLLVIVFCVPATLLSNILIPWILGSFMCKGMAYVQGVAVCASAYSLVAISLDRFQAAYRPIERHQGQGITKHQALFAIAMIWIFSLVITLPWLFVFNVTTEDGQDYCLESWENELAGKMYFLFAQLICCFVIPFFVILFSSIAIWRTVAKRPSKGNSASIQQSMKKVRDNIRKTLGAVTAAFLICWLPLYLLVTCMKFSTGPMKIWGESALFVLLPSFQWLGSLNSCINPVLYAFINEKFRKGFRGIMSPNMK